MAKDITVLYLINDLLEKFLKKADTPELLGDFITKEIREIIGAKIIALYTLNPKTDTYDALAFTPERYHKLSNQKELQQLINLNKKNDKIVISRVDDTATQSSILLKKMDLSNSIIVPLNISNENVGILIVLNLFSEKGLEVIKKVFESLSGILALLLKNINFYQSLDSLVKTRTIELESLNRELQKEILEKEEIRKSLANEKSYVESILNSLSDGLWVINKDMENTFVNPAIREMVGYTKAELEHKKPADIVSKSDVEKVKNSIIKNLRGETTSDSVFMISKSGKEIPVSFISAPVKTHSGETTGAFSVLRDITDIKTAEDKLKKSLEDTISVISYATEKRDPYTFGHQKRVAQLAVAIAKKLNLTRSDIECVYYGSIIHDIGKLYIPSDILNKPGNLSTAEFNIIKEHPEMGYDIIKNVDFIWPIKEIVLHHHEKIDGSGYPNGLKGTEIDLKCRIVTVADVVESMITHRPYRPALRLEDAINELLAKKGILYDEKVVSVCLELFETDKFVFEKEEDYRIF